MSHLVVLHKLRRDAMSKQATPRDFNTIRAHARPQSLKQRGQVGVQPSSSCITHMHAKNTCMRLSAAHSASAAGGKVSCLDAKASTPCCTVYTAKPQRTIAQQAALAYDTMTEQVVCRSSTGQYKVLKAGV